MKYAHLPRHNRAGAFVLAFLAVMLGSLCSAVGAQTSLQVETQGLAPSGRPDQKIERIRTEDAGSRIDEVRVGGQTQSITVQPKIGDNLPAYEVKPLGSARGAAPASTGGDTTGARVWNVLKF